MIFRVFLSLLNLAQIYKSSFKMEQIAYSGDGRKCLSGYESNQCCDPQQGESYYFWKYGMMSQNS